MDIRWAVGVLSRCGHGGGRCRRQLDATGEKGSRLSAEYAYDIDKLADIDPNLILYSQSAAPVKTGFSQSRAIAVDSQGRVFVVGDKAIRIFGSAGDVERTIELSDEPQCVTVADDGGIYVGVRDHVEVLNAEGQSLGSWQGLSGARVDEHRPAGDDIFAADAGNRIVWRYDPSANPRPAREKDLDKNIPGFVIPSPHFDLAVSRDGLLRVANPGRNRIETYTVAAISNSGRFVGIEGFSDAAIR
jgi:hypothetical protein